MKKAVLNFSGEELIETLKNPHVRTQAISFMYRSYFAVLSNHIRQNQGSEQDAEDIFQEVIVTFIEIVRKEKFRGESSIKTFLFTLNKYAWLNELKKRNRASQREEKYESERGVDERDVSSFLIERDAKNLVNSLIEKLGDACKRILTAYYYEGLSMKEILPLVNYDNEQVLRNKKYKCLKTLEQMLAANPGLATRFKSALAYEQ
ncbi:RNA polymerase sigma factor [Mucilaginibacter psychrotolerans]|uniref:Sigma-70 family RNA polymerase sigma factor n=1 Tax=Mucilaginibacter psychrotolerans TaxID=1524096 RepID=A0A4Y8SCF2_9SPHI|nr:sigma-70 family RNA polymerase sigma factor [Mucilaginibacter psychrotolerans]TFF36114.1 sigma-70 family RNA polymerase sigma factor [Mucilaginibacter psychrotolerans]